MFYTQKRSQFISVAFAQVRRYIAKGKYEVIGDAFEGVLVNIEKRDVLVEGEPKPKIYFTFRDGHEEFRLSTNLFDSLCNDIARTLPNVPDLSKKLNFKFKLNIGANGKKYTNLTILQGEQRIPWSDMPQPEKFQRGDEVFTSFVKRNDFVLKALLSVQEKLKTINPDPDVQEIADGDMPDDVYEDSVNAPTAPMSGAPYGAPAAPYGGQPGVPYMGQPAGQFPGYAGQPVSGPYYPAQAPYGPQNGGPQAHYGPENGGPQAPYGPQNGGPQAPYGPQNGGPQGGYGQGENGGRR